MTRRLELDFGSIARRSEAPTHTTWRTRRLRHRATLWRSWDESAAGRLGRRYHLASIAIRRRGLKNRRAGSQGRLHTARFRDQGEPLLEARPDPSVHDRQDQSWSAAWVPNCRAVVDSLCPKLRYRTSRDQ